VFVSEGSERVKTATLSFKLNHAAPHAARRRASVAIQLLSAGGVDSEPLLRSRVPWAGNRPGTGDVTGSLNTRQAVCRAFQPRSSTAPTHDSWHCTIAGPCVTRQHRAAGVTPGV
jgi:hypothetical protein